MKRKMLAICAMTVMLLSGCTDSHILASGGPAEPIFETQDGIVLDWTQIGEEMDEQFVDNADYPMALSVNYSVDPESKSIEMTLIVKDGTTPEEAVKFADAAVRYLNDSAAIQDFSIESSDETSYGGLFKENSLNLLVMPDAGMTQKEYRLVEMTIPAGSEAPIVPKEGAVIIEPTEEDSEEDSEEENSEEEDSEDTEETQKAS